MITIWKCGRPDCLALAMGVGDPVGLRAIGWSWDTSALLCPLHHPDAEEGIASRAVIQYVLNNHYDTFLAKDAGRRLTEGPVVEAPPSPPGLKFNFHPGMLPPMPFYPLCACGDPRHPGHARCRGSAEPGHALCLSCQNGTHA